MSLCVCDVKTVTNVCPCLNLHQSVCLECAIAPDLPVDWQLHQISLKIEHLQRFSLEGVGIAGDLARDWQTEPEIPVRQAIEPDLS